MAVNGNKPNDHRRDEAPKQYFISCILSEGNEFQEGTGRKEGEKARLAQRGSTPSPATGVAGLAVAPSVESTEEGSTSRLCHWKRRKREERR